jgi:hypothetical protein
MSTSQRHKLKGPFTPVTPETFAIWLKQRADKKSAEAEAKEKAKATQRAAGRVNGMSGRHMFEFGGIQDEEVSFRGVSAWGNAGFGWLIVEILVLLLQEGEDEDWDIQRYLADRDKDARAESAADEDEEDYRRRHGEDGSDDGEGREGDDQDDQDEDGGEKEANGDDAAGDGAASKSGKESGLADDEVQEAVDKLEKVRVAT